jgi:hypothetical protein
MEVAGDDGAVAASTVAECVEFASALAGVVAGSVSAAAAAGGVLP